MKAAVYWNLRKQRSANHIFSVQFQCKFTVYHKGKKQIQYIFLRNVHYKVIQEKVKKKKSLLALKVNSHRISLYHIQWSV